MSNPTHHFYFAIHITSENGRSFGATCSTPSVRNVVIPITGAVSPSEALESMLDLLKMGIHHGGGDVHDYLRSQDLAAAGPVEEEK